MSYSSGISVHLISSAALAWTMAFFAALALGIAAFPRYISFLRRRQIQQFLRIEGPASHANKAKTPTAGGICFILVSMVTSLFIMAYFGCISKVAIWVMILACACASIGLFDDLAKIRHRTNRGLSAQLRLILEVGAGFSFGLALIFYAPQTQNLFFPNLVHIVSVSPYPVDGHIFMTVAVPSLVFLGLTIFLIPATTNALNLHDGMDGLAGGNSCLILLALSLMLWAAGQIGLSLLAAANLGALTAFLFFNKYPAKIFMGDTGSLYLGGLMAGLTMASGMLIWFIPLSLILVVETLSVIFQVSYFKLTKPYEPPEPIPALKIVWLKLTRRLPGEGKRLLRMAPLHHHFESLLGERGIAEWQVVLGFWLIQALFCSIVIFIFFRF